MEEDSSHFLPGVASPVHIVTQPYTPGGLEATVMAQQSDDDSSPAPAPIGSGARGPSGCLIFALAVAFLFAASVAIIVIGGGDRVLKALEIIRGAPQVTTVQVSPGEMLPVLKLAVEELHTTIHTTRTGPVLGGAAQSLPRHIIAQGTVTACFNLENKADALETLIDPQDPEHITVRLPPPEYCFLGIDNAQFFDEAGVGLAPGNEVNGLLLEDAKQQLFTAAESQNLLPRARQRGTDQIQLLLYKLGFKRVDVEFSQPTHVE